MKEGVFDPQRRALTWGVIVSVSLVGFEAMAVATILPTAATQLHGLGTYGWAFSAFMLANVVGTMAVGQLADERGPVAPLLAGAASIAAGLLVAAAAGSWNLLIFARILQGLGGGVVMTLAFLSIRRGYPERLRPKMMAILSSAWVLPSLVGPLAAGALAQSLSWRWVFILLLPFVLATILLMLPALRGFEAPPSAGRGSVGGEKRILFTVLLALSLAGLLASLELRTLWFLPVLGSGLLLATGFASLILPAGTLAAQKGLPAGLAFRAILTFIFFGAESFVPLGFATLRGFTPVQGGLVLTGASLSWVAGSWTQARLDEKDGGRTRGKRLVGGFALVVGGIVAMAAVAFAPGIPVILSVLGWAVAGYGMGLAYPTTSVIVLGMAPPGREGWISSSLNLVENVGIALGAGLAGAAFDWGRFLGMADPDRLALSYLVILLPAALGLYAVRRVLR